MSKFEFVEAKHPNVFQRFEAKYLITELEAEDIKNYIGPYVFSDPYQSGERGYDVTSLYLDSPDLRMFWSSRLGEKNRFKLRIRGYTEDPSQPVFFEIKQRVDRIIKKQRAIVSRDATKYILEGDKINTDMLVRPNDEKEFENLYMFRDYMDMFAARPFVMVKYLRDAYMSNLEEPVRITFDRYLACMPVDRYGQELWYGNQQWREINEPPVILEIKFTDMLPSWVRQVIHRFHLLRDSQAKYVTCVTALRDEGFPMGGLMETVAI